VKLGYLLPFEGSKGPADAGDTISEIEDLGYDSLWSAEAWGSDALSPLAWWGGHTTRLRLGTSVMQISARTATATAMAAATLDHLSGGRLILGLGVSGPQVVEGWYGQPFERPLARTREYVEIIRKALARNEPVTADGPAYPLPRPGGTGLGKALKMMMHPLRPDIPIMLGAVGPKNRALTAEIGDGWLPGFYSPTHEHHYRPSLQEGWDRTGDATKAARFEIAPTVPVVIDDDPDRAADALRPILAIHIGGMGAESANFHFDLFAGLGFEAEATAIQGHFLAGRMPDAAAAVPLKMVEAIALVGPMDKIRDDLAAWNESMVTTMILGGVPMPVSTLRTMAELVL
jgi:F420-dependent oxidoreductase-like protein